MRKLLGYLFTPIHLVIFGLILAIFHAIQWLAFNLGGYKPHKISVDFLNYSLMRSLLLLGSHCRFRNDQKLPTDRPLIVVSNHQSLYDIPPIFWFLRKHHIKFVSKVELGKGIPSISYNLRHGGSVLINRKDPRQALPAMKKFAQYIEENNYTACIFPEGTRSRDGNPKKFATTGLKTLMKYAPSALIVPITINESWRIVQYGMYPMSFGEQPTWQVHAPIEFKGRKVDEVLEEVERTIKAAIK